METREDPRPAPPSDTPPRVGIFLFAQAGAGKPSDVASLLPSPVRLRTTEIVWVDEASQGSGASASPMDAEGDAVRVLRTPGPRGYGGARKAAFDYAIQRGLDLAITIRADGVHPIEMLEPLLNAALAAPDRVTIAARFLSEVPERDGPTFLRRTGHHWSNRLVNALLRLDLTDYLSGLRAYPTAALDSVPFHLDADGRDFDMELLIQLRALGAEFEEIRVACRKDKPRFRDDGR